MTARSLKAERGVKDKRRRILDAARKLLVARGFQDIVLDDVARDAGVAKGTLFLYFPSKDAIVSAALADLVERMGAVIAELEGSPLRGEALLLETTKRVLDYLDRNRDFLFGVGTGRFMGCGTKSSSRLMEQIARNMEHAAALMRRCAADRLFPPGAAADAAQALFALCRSSALQPLYGGKAVPLARRARRVCEILLYGVRGKR